MDNLRLTIELLPKGAWGNNLRKRLTQKNWDTLRNICYEKAEYRCSICGKRDEQLDAHEVWDFDIGSQTQTLQDIVALCRACHGVKHIRNSERIGYSEHAKAHFLKINKCSPLELANHYAKAILLFDERNNVLRWKLVADLQKFGGKDMKIKSVNIPIIVSPYENVNFETVKHVRLTVGQHDGHKIHESILEKEIIFLQADKDTDKASVSNQQSMYFVSHKPNILPPKIRSIAIDNYSGKITVESDRVNKIIWLSRDKIIKTNYNFGGIFTNDFSVENLEYSPIHFVLIGTGGKTESQPFELIDKR